MAKKVLFVEGEVDTYFFFALMKAMQLETVEILPKHGVGKIPPALTEAIKDLGKTGGIERLGIMADADHTGVNDGGFAKRWTQLTTPLNDAGYTITAQPTSENKGSIFHHTNGLPSVGLWLMPNHLDDGSLENLVLNTAIKAQVISNGSISITQQDLITQSQQAIHTLATQNKKIFASHHDAKAKAFTWLAWQKKPRHFIGEVIDYKNTPSDNLIDTTSSEIQGLCDWWVQVFS